MPDKPNEDPKATKPDPKDGPRVSKRARIVTPLRITILILVLAVALLLAQGLLRSVIPLGDAHFIAIENLPVVGRILSSARDSVSGKAPAPVFRGESADTLVSQKTLLAMVGGSPVDPSRVLFPTFEKSVSSEPVEDAKAPPPDQASPPEAVKTKEKDSETSRDTGKHFEETGPGKPAPRLVETPIVVTRQPPAEDSGAAKRDKKLNRKTTGKKTARDKKPEAVKSGPPRSVAGEPPSSVRSISKRGDLTASIPKEQRPDTEPVGKPEKYLLPGSLQVNVKNYKGTRVEWGLMVILDDSAAMGRKVKPWKPNRMQAASELVQKLQRRLTPGSKISVRDFYCKRSKRKKKSGQPLCLSHVLFPWAELPAKGLKAELEKTRPAGRTNPCAAAAYSLRKDFTGIAELQPRVLLVTRGVNRCAYRKVLREVNRKGLGRKARVDVVGLGIGKKRRRGYEALARKTGGIFIRLDNPSGVESAVTRYEKVLKTPTFKKMEVRGEKTSFRVANGEEITLAPGAYTILLPEMPGLKPGNRAVKDVKIVSGQNRILNVRIRKGRLHVRTGKK